jgi:hypothetical protein
MFSWLPAEHLQRRPSGLGAVLTSEVFTSGCAGSSSTARWLPNGMIESDGDVPIGLLAKEMDQWTELIRSAAVREGIPAQFIAGVMATESNGQQNAHTSCCYGLMGFLPATASSVAGRTVTPQELMSNPKFSIDLGAKLIKQLLTKYKGNIVKVTLAYNAGSVKCGAPKKCPDAPNRWNAVTDCADGLAVDYPGRTFGFSNAWLKQHGGTGALNFNLNIDFGPAFYVTVLLKTAAVLGIGYVAYKGLKK